VEYLKSQEEAKGSPSPRTPKPSIRELVKKYDAENSGRFENENDNSKTVKEME